MILSAQAEHSLSYSSHCLKQAIPLMVKYKMPITPLNYAIWYAYVSNKTPELNDALDKIINEFKTCSHEHAKALFNQFLSSDDLALFYQLSGGFNDVVGKVHQDINEAINYSTEFNQTLQECHLKLKNADISQETGFDDVLDCVERLSDESATLQSRAQDFQNQLAQAYAEITDLKQELIRSKDKAQRDPLTGLLNRGKFDEDIKRFCKNNELAQVSVLTMIDIDHFKSFNDNFGHQKGDQVLRAVSAKLLKHVSSIGQVYRYGGEEFCFTAQFASISDMTNFTQLLRQTIAKLQIKKPNSDKVLSQVTASFGIAIKAKNSNPEQLIAKADKALYLAKEHGRNRIEIVEE
tara:strand:- start:877 stop:1926 length:1050 start_codon:yes stop_codon:yes gene_type:complete